MIKWSDGIFYNNSKKASLSEMKLKVFSNDGSPFYLSGIPKDRLVNHSSLIDILECMLC